MITLLCLRKQQSRGEWMYRAQEHTHPQLSHQEHLSLAGRIVLARVRNVICRASNVRTQHMSRILTSGADRGLTDA